VIVHPYLSGLSFYFQWILVLGGKSLLLLDVWLSLDQGQAKVKKESVVV